VPTGDFRILFVVVVLAPHRRRVIHFNVTAHPTSDDSYRAVLEFLARTGGATTVELAHQLVERPRQSKSLKFAGLASGWEDWSCLVALCLATNTQDQSEVLADRRRTRKQSTWFVRSIPETDPLLGIQFRGLGSELWNWILVLQPWDLHHAVRFRESPGRSWCTPERVEQAAEKRIAATEPVPISSGRRHAGVENRGHVAM
jgi:hypothetical protein